MEEKIVIQPGVDMKSAFIQWFFNQGPQFIVTALFCAYFGWKTHQLEARLDACQNAHIEEISASANSVINAVETLIGKLEQQVPEYRTPAKRLRQ